MVCAARILSTRLHASRLSLIRFAHRHLFHFRSPTSSTGAWSIIRHYSISSHAVRPLFHAGYSIGNCRELHSQTQVSAEAECLRRDSHPCWPEWFNFLESLAGAGYSDATADLSAAEDIVPDFPTEVLGSATVCLTFARDRPTLLGMLPMGEIEVVVQNVTPFRFRDGDESERRMRSYIRSRSCNELDMDKATMMDLMKYILSYISNPTDLDEKSDSNVEQVESSLKNLLSELAKLNYGVSASSITGIVHSPFLDGNEQQLSSVKKVEMKRGDWICPRCNFMNFARNVKCLECEEARPKRQFLNGEWECPQCDYFNYGRNTVCFRCECKRPGGILLGSINTRSGSGLGDANCSANTDSVNSDLEKKLAANEEKAQRWFRKISEVNSTSDMSSAIDDEDFPEIIPLRKGVNKFVVSTRKTPLERRLANSSQHQGDMGDGINSVNETLKERIGKSVDQILGHSSTASDSETNMAYSAWKPMSNQNNLVVSHPFDHLTGENNRNQSRIVSTSQSSASYPLKCGSLCEPNSQVTVSKTWNQEPSGENMGENSMRKFVGNSHSAKDGGQGNWNSGSSWKSKLENDVRNNGTRLGGFLNENSFNPPTSTNASWRTGYQNQHNASIEANGMHVTGNSFQMSNSNGWGSQYSGGGNANFATSETHGSGDWFNGSAVIAASGTGGNFSLMSDSGNANASFASKGTWRTSSQNSYNLQSSNNCSGYSHQSNASFSGTQNVGHPSKNSFNDNGNVNASFASNGTWRNSSQNSYNPQSSNNCFGYSHQSNASFSGTQNVGHPSQNSFNPQTHQPSGWNNGYSHHEGASKWTNMATKPCQTSAPENTNAQNTSVSWSGKSLEGSGIREPDALDMSEEAKAERWFKRVAEIKDISELSKIPDEDFPSIMPMRKGVNRFVVSKRKTPLERKLTSQQYRRNLPIITSSESLKSENEE